jgi:hypothetical protein
LNCCLQIAIELNRSSQTTVHRVLRAERLNDLVRASAEPLWDTFAQKFFDGLENFFLAFARDKIEIAALARIARMQTLSLQYPMRIDHDQTLLILTKDCAEASPLRPNASRSNPLARCPAPPMGADRRRPRESNAYAGSMAASKMVHQRNVHH